MDRVVGERAVVDVLRDELVALRERRGATAEKVEQRAPRLMYLPCVDAELVRRALADIDRPNATLRVLECMTRSGELHSHVCTLIAMTLNFSLSQSTLEERRREVQDQLGILDFPKQYLRLEEDAYQRFARALFDAVQSPCAPDTNDGVSQQARRRRLLKLRLETLILEFGDGDDSAAIQQIREILDDLAPVAAALFFPRDEVASPQHLMNLLRVIAHSRYDEALKGGFLRVVPAQYLFALPYLDLLLTVSPDIPSEGKLLNMIPRDVYRMDIPSLRQFFERSSADPHEILLDTTEVCVGLIEHIEMAGDWAEAIAEARRDRAAKPDWSS